MTFIGPPDLLALVFAVYLVAGTVKGALGFGLPVVAITLLPFLVPVETALALNSLVILATNLQQIGQAGAARQGLRAGWPMMLGMAIMVPVGAFFTAGISAPVLMTVLGSFVLLFVLSSFLHPTLRVPTGWERPVGFGMGLVSGFVGALTSSPGPIFVMYIVALHLPRPVYMAALGCIMSLFGLVVSVSYAWVGIVQWQHVPTGALALVPAITGMWLGNRLGQRLGIETFRKAVLGMLGILAVVMIRRALT